MKIRAISDIHLEFDDYAIPSAPDDLETVLVLAGDICLINGIARHTGFFEQINGQFRTILYVPGNHEYYNSDLRDGLENLKQNLSQFDRIHVLNNECLHIDNVTFVCSTMWSNFENNDWFSKQHCRMGCSDFILIKENGKQITPDKLLHKFETSKTWIFASIFEQKEQDRKVVVVTHHGCTHASTHPRYAMSPINGLFVSNLEKEIFHSEPDIWIHGHVHDSFDYQVGKTRVVTNPRGYSPHQINKLFDPFLTLEV